MTNRSKLLSKSECNKTLEEGHCKTRRDKYERDSYENIQTLNYAYMQHLEIISDTLQLAKAGFFKMSENLFL